MRLDWPMRRLVRPAAPLLAIAAGPLWLATAVPSAAVAQTPDNSPLSMTDAVRAAVQTHPSVRGARQQVLQAGEGVEAAKAGYRPQITGGIEGQTNSYRNSSYDSRHVYTARLNASQMLYDFGKVAGATRQAKAGVRATEAQVQLVTDEIVMSTAQAWVDAHLQQRLTEIAREQLDAVMSITALVRERVEKGATSRSDLEQASSRVESLRSQLLAAEAEAQRASLTLMHLTGRVAPVAIAGDIPPMLQNAACQSNLETDTAAVRVALARRDEARAQLDVARAERLPTISLDGNVGQALTEGSRLYGEYRTTGQIGLNLSMPLYQGGATEARARGAQYQLRAYEDAVQQARLEASQGLADARAQVVGWAERAPVLEKRVASIDATRELYRQQYLQLGTRSLLDLLNAEQEYYSARVEQAQGTHVQYRLAVQCLYFRDRLRTTFGLDEGGAMAKPALTIGERE